VREVETTYEDLKHLLVLFDLVRWQLVRGLNMVQSVSHRLIAVIDGFQLECCNMKWEAHHDVVNSTSIAVLVVRVRK
jgi:hypothetical protein